MTTKLPRYTPVLVADPTMPLPHAAAAGVVAPYRNASDYDGGNWVERLEGPNGWDCQLGEPEDRTWGRDGSPVVEELNRLAAELDESRAMEDFNLNQFERAHLLWVEVCAERDGLRADVAAWVAKATRIEIERADAEARAEAAEAERDRLSAELAALRGVMPDPAELEAGADLYMRAWRLDPRDMEVWHAADRMRELAAAIAATMGEVIENDPAVARAAALATATPTPPAAEAGTGGEDAPPGGWRDPLAALDQPQEATDGE